MRLEFLPEAEAEFCEASLYYEAVEKGLGKRFRNEILEICSAMLEHPLLWRERAGGYRRVNAPVFPYYVAYFIDDDRIVVAAIAHGARQPDFWKERLD